MKEGIVTLCPVERALNPLPVQLFQQAFNPVPILVHLVVTDHRCLDFGGFYTDLPNLCLCLSAGLKLSTEGMRKYYRC